MTIVKSWRGRDGVLIVRRDGYVIEINAGTTKWTYSEFLDQTNKRAVKKLLTAVYGKAIIDDVILLVQS